MPPVQAGIVIRSPWDLNPAAGVYLDVPAGKSCERPFEYLLATLISSVQELHNTIFRFLEYEAEKLAERVAG